MSMQILMALQKEAEALNTAAVTLTTRAKWVASVRERAAITGRKAFTVVTSGDEWAYNRPRTEAVEAAFQAAIAPIEDHILATMEEGFMAEAAKATLRAKAIEARIEASIILPEPLP